MDNTEKRGEDAEYDKVAQASLNGIYVKAQELDRGHNDTPAPAVSPPGAVQEADAEAHASTHASDAESHASTHAGDAESHASTHAGDTESHASTHAGGGSPADAESGASR